MSLKIKVIAVQGNQIQITDNTKTMIVSREQLDKQLKAGVIEIETLKVKCLDKQRDKNNIIINYMLQDKNGKTIVVSPQQLKQAIYNYQVDCVNLTLTSDNRLIDSEEDKNNTPSNTNKQLETPNKNSVTNNETVAQNVVTTQVATVINTDHILKTFVKYDNNRISCNDENIKSWQIDAENQIQGVDYVSAKLSHLVSLDELIVSDRIFSISINSDIGKLCLDKIVAKTKVSFSYDVESITINSIKATKISLDTKCTLYSDNKVINIETLILNGICNIADGVTVNIYVYKEIDLNSSEIELINEYHAKNQLNIYTKYNTKAFTQLISRNIPFELIDKENEDKLKLMQNKALKENMIGRSTLETTYEKYNKIYNENVYKPSEMVEVTKGLNVEVPSNIQDAYRMRLYADTSETIREEFNDLIDTIIKLTPVCGLPFTTKFVKLATNDTKFKFEYKDITGTGHVNIGLLAIAYTGVNDFDTYILITNGNKIIHMALIDNLTIGTTSINLKACEEAYNYFNSIKGVTSDGSLIQTLTSKKPEDDTRKKLSNFAYELINRKCSIYIKNSNTLILTGGSKPILFKYEKFKSDKLTTLINNTISKYRSNGFTIIDNPNIEKIYSSIRRKFESLYNDSVSKYIQDNVDEDTINTDESKIKEQKQSCIWSIAQECKQLLMTTSGPQNFFESIDMDTMQTILDFPIFNEISYKDYNKIKQSYKDITIERQDFQIISESCNTQSKIIGDYMNLGKCKIAFINNISGDDYYYVGSMSLSRVYHILYSIINGEYQNYGVNSVYTRSSNYTESELNEALNKELDMTTNPTIVDMSEHGRLLDRCTSLYETSNWRRSSSRDKYRKFYVAICNETGLIYGILESGRRNGHEYRSFVERIVCRIADTPSALKIIKKLEYEAEHKKSMRYTASIIDDMLDYGGNLTHKLAKLQINNISEQQAYKDIMTSDNYDLYKDFISFFNGKLESEYDTDEYSGYYGEYSDQDTDDEYYDDGISNQGDNVDAAASIYERLKNAGMM